MAQYQIAGLAVEMDVFGRTLRQAVPYEETFEGPADIRVTCDPQQLLELHPELRDLDAAEDRGSGTSFAKQLLKHGGFQLHSSAVLLEGKAYLFSAPSGTGKSTHTEKWCRLYGAAYLNDDKPALRRGEDGWTAYGTPWSGKHDLSMPRSAPLGSVAFLRQGEANEICRLEPAEGVEMLISQSLRFLNAEQMGLQLDLLDRLLREVPVWQLTCRNDDAAAELSYRHMVR